MAFDDLAVVGWSYRWRVLDLMMRGAFAFDEPAQVFTNGPGLIGLGLAVLGRGLQDDPRTGVSLDAPVVGPRQRLAEAS